MGSGFAPEKVSHGPPQWQTHLLWNRPSKVLRALSHILATAGLSEGDASYLQGFSDVASFAWDETPDFESWRSCLDFSFGEGI